MKHLVLILIAGSTLLFDSCKKDREDTIAPSVFIVRVNGAAEQTTISAGDTITIYSEIKDNVNLSQFRIDIHDNFIEHSDRNTAFSSQLTYSISGTAVYETKTIIIPTTASSGPYHIVVSALDEAGLESNIYQYDLTIIQAGQPVITVTSHNIDSTITINVNDTINLVGTVTDDIDLDSVKIWLENSAGAKIYSIDSYLAGSSDTLSNITTPVTGAIAVGTYSLIFRMLDSDGNYTMKETEVTVQ